MTAPALHSFAGAIAPPGLGDELAGFAALTPPARERFWELLEPNLANEVSDRVEALVEQFCVETGVTPTQLVPVVRACRQIFRTAAGIDVGVEQVAEDLKALLADRADAAETIRRLTACYAKALARIRSANIVAFMTEYGPVLDKVRIRVDYVRTSRHDASAMVPVALMSLRYREGEDDKHLTLQASMSTLIELRHLCNALIQET